MGSRLDSLFEEDVQMQDALEDIGNLTDNSEDIILGIIEDRANDKESAETHLFTNESSEQETNEDGLTPEEEREVAMALLNGEDDLGLDDDDLIDLALAD